MLVVLLRVGEGEVSLDPEAVEQLARLGVTSVALLRDEETMGVVLEGWAFDPEGSAEEAVSSVAGEGRSPRTLRPVLQLAVQAVSTDR